MRLRLAPTAVTKQINTMCVRPSGGQEGLRLQSEMTGSANADILAATHSVAAAHVMLLALLPGDESPGGEVHCSINFNSTDLALG